VHTKHIELSRDRCTIKFNVPYPFFLTSPAKKITCGGLPNGRTDLTQFALPDQLGNAGYSKYCLQTLPVCTCSSGANATVGPQCCDGASPQHHVAGVPQTVVNPGPAETVSSFKIGYKYGYCFYSYPSMAVSTVTRCLPVPAGTKTSNGNATVGAAFLSSISAGASENKSSLLTFDDGLQSVLDAASSPQAAFSGLVHEVNVNKWVIVGSAGIALLVSLLYTQLLRLTARGATYILLLALWFLLAAATLIMAIKSGYIQASQVPADRRRSNSPPVKLSNCQTV
jgi:hypothetical protein